MLRGSDQMVMYFRWKIINRNMSYDLGEQNSKGICTCNTSFLETCTHTIISSYVESRKQNYSIYLDTITSIKPMTYYPKTYLDRVVQIVHREKWRMYLYHKYYIVQAPNLFGLTKEIFFPTYHIYRIVYGTSNELAFMPLGLMPKTRFTTPVRLKIWITLTSSRFTYMAYLHKTPIKSFKELKNIS